MKFSIILPTLGKRQEMLERAIDSILNQKYDDFELIISHNGNEPKPIFPKDDRIIYLYNAKPSIAAAINAGIRVATGDIFNESNDDDLMLPNALQTVADNIEDSKWLYGAVLWGNSPKLHHWDYETLKQANYLAQPSVYWTREAYTSVGEWDESVDLAADYDYWLRLGKLYEPKVVPDVLASYTIHPNQLTQTNLTLQLEHVDKIRQRL